MGERAVFRIYSDDHAGAFESPYAPAQFQLPAIARWIEACRWQGQAPSAQNYWDHAQTDTIAQHFTHTYPVDDLDPNDLSWRYELRSITANHGWTAELTVWARGTEPLAGFHVIHQAWLGSELTAPIHLLAADALTELIHMVDPDDPLAAAIPTWRHQAETHASYANLSGTPQHN